MEVAPKKRLPDSLQNGLSGPVGRWNALSSNALKTAALPPGIFWIQHCCEKLAFGNSIVLRTRRSTLGRVYV
jgi:hypothetical protein